MAGSFGTSTGALGLRRTIVLLAQINEQLIQFFEVLVDFGFECREIHLIDVGDINIRRCGNELKPGM